MIKKIIIILLSLSLVFILCIGIYKNIDINRGKLLVEEDAIWIARYYEYFHDGKDLRYVCSEIKKNEGVTINPKNWIMISSGSEIHIRSAKDYRDKYLFVISDKSLNWSRNHTLPE